MRSTPSVSSLASSDLLLGLISLSSMSSILPKITGSSSSSSLSSSMAPTSPVLFFRDCRRLADSDSLSLNAEKPTVPVVFRGPRLERSSWPDRRFVEVEVGAGVFEGTTPIFCSWPVNVIS